MVSRIKVIRWMEEILHHLKNLIANVSFRRVCLR